MGTKSKFFRAFVEGQTISDGRKIDADWIDQIVETFNTDTYPPRINVEHLSGYSPEPPFNGYGNVVGVRAQTDDIEIAGKSEKRKALYCQVDGNDQLVALVAKNQKPYPSVELTDSYAGSGKIGLLGLAFTDKPASIGTQALQFSRTAPGSLFSQSPDAVGLEFEGKPVEATSVADAIKAGFASVASMFKSGEPEKPKEEPKPKHANDNGFEAFAIAMGDTMATTLAAALKPITDAQTSMQGEFATLKGKLEATPETSFNRAPASGGTGEPATDC
jgi:hypothetical protein